MKKALFILLVVVLILAGVAVWFWRSMGFTDVARLVPAETVAIVSLPDLPRSAFRWPQTILAQIGAEPEMRAFLEKPLQFLSSNQGGEEATDILIRLKPTCIFASAVHVSSQEAALLVGFQFWGGAHDYDSAIARLRQELDRGLPPPPPPQTETYHGDDILSTPYRGATLYTARHGHWGFLSNNIATLKQSLDRSAGRLSGNSLADNPLFKESRIRLVKDPDIFMFVQPRSVLDTLLAVGATMGAQSIPGQIEQVRQVEALAGAIKFDGPNLHDSLFILRRDPPDIGTLSHQAVKLTTRETTIYFDFLLNFHQLFALGNSPALAPILNGPAMQGSRLPSLIPEALGPECGVVLTWVEGDFKPKGVLAIQVRDAAKADAVFQEFLTLFPQAMATELSGARIYNIPSLQGLLANPTFAVVEGFVLVGIDVPDIERAIAAMRVSDSLEKSPEFTAAIPAYRKANEVFGFVDTREVFSRAYPMLRQVMIFGAAVTPGAAGIVDTGKLPETATIARHLKPIVYTQTRFKDGYLIESEGPITMNQAVVLGAVAASSFFKPASNP